MDNKLISGIAVLLTAMVIMAIVLDVAEPLKEQTIINGIPRKINDHVVEMTYVYSDSTVVYYYYEVDPKHLQEAVWGLQMKVRHDRLTLEQQDLCRRLMVHVIRRKDYVR